MRRLKLLLVSLLAACTPRIEAAGPNIQEARIETEALIMQDGARLPLRSWLPKDAPKSVVLALHGFNDYANAFDMPGKWLAERGVAVYAYDQRGFGQAPHPGIWAGTPTLVGDLKQAAALIKARHPGQPFFLLGESMGGAVLLAAFSRPDPPKADAAILSAPAVWGRRTMAWPQRAALWFFSHTLPFATGSAKGMNIWPSDNLEMLRALSKDPLVIKETRADAVHGLTDLMDEALASAPLQKGPFLLLYGAKEEIIPPKSTTLFLENLGKDCDCQLRYFPNGYHMLLRDLQAQAVYREILDYLASKSIRGSTR